MTGCSTSASSAALRMRTLRHRPAARLTIQNRRPPLNETPREILHLCSLLRRPLRSTARGTLSVRSELGGAEGCCHHPTTKTLRIDIASWNNFVHCCPKKLCSETSGQPLQQMSKPLAHKNARTPKMTPYTTMTFEEATNGHQK